MSLARCRRSRLAMQIMEFVIVSMFITHMQQFRTYKSINYGGKDLQYTHNTAFDIYCPRNLILLSEKNVNGGTILCQQIKHS